MCRMSFTYVLYFYLRFMGDLYKMKADRPAGLKYMMWQEAAMKTNINVSELLGSRQGRLYSTVGPRARVT